MIKKCRKDELLKINENMSFIVDLETAFQENSNSENAVAMGKYMKNHFTFFGMQTDNRRLIFNAIWKENQEELGENARTIATEFYSKNQRELHYCAIEILIKEFKINCQKQDISLIEYLITTHSWWDSVDVIAKYLLGKYLMQFPDETENIIQKCSNSENLWLNRSAILFQLGYKEKTNADLLFALCRKHSDSNAFFIQKSIGWALREYAKKNPTAVRNFVEATKLKPLSKKEALKNLG